jgi:hypothetical protein
LHHGGVIEARISSRRQARYQRRTSSLLAGRDDA